MGLTQARPAIVGPAEAAPGPVVGAAVVGADQDLDLENPIRNGYGSIANPGPLTGKKKNNKSQELVPVRRWATLHN